MYKEKTNELRPYNHRATYVFKYMTTPFHYTFYAKRILYDEKKRKKKLFSNWVVVYC